MAEGILGPLPDPIVAPPDDLPGPVAAALANPTRARRGTQAAAGYAFAFRSWGTPDAQPLLLVHGVTSSSATWWRIGPALAASGRLVVAPDLPGHGRTGGWCGRHRFVETAEDLLAFIRAADLERPELEVIGHSWGGMICAALPAVGLRPRRLVLFDPPTWTRADFEAYVREPTEQPFDSLVDAAAAMRAANPSWHERDVQAKAESLTQFEETAARAVVLENGDWDSGLSALAEPAAAGIPTWLIRGDPAAGGMIPDEAAAGLVEGLGPDRVITIAGAPHSAHRTHPAATVAAILRAIA